MDINIAVRPQPRAVAHARWRSDSQVWGKVRRERWMYAFVLPGFVFFVVFRYLPLLGNIIAFEDYSPYLGFFDSPWVGFDNFAALFTSPAVGNALINTLIINGLQIIAYFPATIGLALLLNSLVNVAEAHGSVHRLLAVLHRLGGAGECLGIGSRR